MMRELKQTKLLIAEAINNPLVKILAEYLILARYCPHWKGFISYGRRSLNYVSYNFNPNIGYYADDFYDFFW